MGAEDGLERTRANAFESRKLLFAFIVAVAAIAALILILLIGAWHWSDAKDGAAVISPIAGVVGTIVGAYLGHQAGSAGRERDAADKRECERIAQQLAAVADPTAAAKILGIDCSREPPTN